MPILFQILNPNAMKKVILLIALLCCISVNCNAQISLCAYFDKHWSSWVTGNAQIKGNYDGFIIYSQSEGPWNYRFKFTIDNFKVPNKKQRKKDIKKGEFYTYKGTVEYYTSYNFPSALSIFREAKGPAFCPAKLNSGIPAKKITSRATIKVAPFKRLPKTYNIWYDNVALGIDLEALYFRGTVFP